MAVKIYGVIWFAVIAVAFATQMKRFADDIVVYEDPKHDVTMDELYAGALLPENDILYMFDKEDNTTCGPIPPGYIGIRLERSETVELWKAVALHRKDDYDYYKFILELEGDQRPSTSVFLRQDILFNYDICLWKDTGGFLGRFVPENTYRIVDAPETMVDGVLYTLVWYRDEYSQTDNAP